MTPRKTDPRNLSLQAQRDITEVGEITASQKTTEFMAMVLARVSYRGMREGTAEELTRVVGSGMITQVSTNHKWAEEV